jgi:hypothetical protein
LHSIFVALQNYITDTNCRLKRHLFSTSIHELGRPAENKPANVICAQEAFEAENGDKLYAKVLTISPNRLLQSSAQAL